MSTETRDKLVDAALATLVEHGIAKASARAIATTAGVNQALVFYHFGSVDELLAEACRRGARARVAAYRQELGAVATLGELLDLGRRMHASEQEAGYVAVLAQLLAGAQSHEPLRAPTAEGLGVWVAEVEVVLERVLTDTALAGLVDVPGLARAFSAAFVGLELYEGVDPDGATRALDSLEQLAELVAVLDELGPVAERAVRRRLRRGRRR